MDCQNTTSAVIAALPSRDVQNALPRALIAAYLQTRYELHLPGDSTSFHIGAANRALDRWLARQRCSELVFVTAWNPRSEPRSRWANLRRNTALQRQLRMQRWRLVTALGVPLAGEWPAEESLAVLDMSCQRGVRLGRRYGQHAIVHAGRRTGARLVLL